ncbi:hypothetical protein DCC81_08480 [Chitinophaga parva]|uniref:HTH araC/xylS-type domain-containing protein n=1 Tax=Chitinophaga parva TaxID=2169414 RepID=A0A2T7BPA2_9BACT|nr:AraC family transcriptional regulator [Chitinophaga parva]PUZ29470.1 hypothetical protein DCC81_08480 [Chitinophaga parva]
MRFQLAEALGMLGSTGLPVPGCYQEYVYTFADPVFASHPFVDIIVQERKVQHFLIASHVVVVKEPVWLDLHTDESACTLYCMLRGNLECAMEGFPQPVWFVQGQYFLFCVSKGTHRAFFEPGVYQSFYINFSPHFLAEIAPAHDPVLQLAWQRQQSAALTGSLWYPLYECMDELRNDTADSRDNDQRLINVMEHMLLLVVDRKRGRGIADSRTMIDESVLYSVQHYINFHLFEPLNLQSLARRFGLQPLEVQEMFLRRSRNTVEVFVFSQRMEMARQLLENTRLRIAEILQQVGYKRRGLFTKAYQEHFNMLPSQSRRPSSRMRLPRY